MGEDPNLPSARSNALCAAYSEAPSAVNALEEGRVRTDFPHWLQNPLWARAAAPLPDGRISPKRLLTRACYDLKCVVSRNPLTTTKTWGTTVLAEESTEDVALWVVVKGGERNPDLLALGRASVGPLAPQDGPSSAGNTRSRRIWKHRRTWRGMKKKEKRSRKMFFATFT